MIGNTANPGIMVQTLRDLFAASHKGGGKRLLIFVVDFLLIL